MLTDEEWEEISTLISLDIERIKNYREFTGSSLKEANSKLNYQAFDRYFEITGIREKNLNALWHHHLSLYGDQCSSCGHLLRSPNASFCANCGNAKD